MSDIYITSPSGGGKLSLASAGFEDLCDTIGACSRKKKNRGEVYKELKKKKKKRKTTFLSVSYRPKDCL